MIRIQCSPVPPLEVELCHKEWQPVKIKLRAFTMLDASFVSGLERENPKTIFTIFLNQLSEDDKAIMINYFDVGAENADEEIMKKIGVSGGNAIGDAVNALWEASTPDDTEKKTAMIRRILTNILCFCAGYTAAAAILAGAGWI